MFLLNYKALWSFRSSTAILWENLPGKGQPGLKNWILKFRSFRTEKRPFDVFWFVGDYASYHPRVKKVTIAFAKLLHKLGVDFCILGPDEHSDGDSQRLAGERGLFEMLAEKNAKMLSKCEFPGDHHHRSPCL